VQDNDYVVADRSGITLTGLTGELDIAETDGRKLAGLDVSGKILVGYSNPGDGTKEVSLAGNINLDAPPGSTFKLENISGGLDLDISIDSSGTSHFDGFGIDVGGQFNLLGLDVKTLVSQPFGFHYSVEKGQFEVGGGLEATLKGNSVFLALGTLADPSLVVKNGEEVTLSNVTINWDFTINGVKISTSPGNGINLSYDSTKSLFEMYGGISVTLPGGANVTGMLGTAAEPGMIYDTSKKDLQQINATLSGSFTVEGLTFQADNFGVLWTRGDGTAQNPETFEITGQLTLNVKAFQVAVDSGEVAKHPGLLIQNGSFVVDDIKITVENVQLGPLTLRELEVGYKNTGTGYEVDVDADIWLPAAGQGIDGDFVVKNGKLDSITLSYLSQEGIELGTSGAKLISVDAEVMNIENPSQIVVEGKVGVVYGETVSMFGTEVNLFHAEGDVTVDADEFILDCVVQVGAYSNDNGKTWQRKLGKGEGKLNLNWHSQVYSLHLEADGVATFFDIDADLVFAAGRDVILLAEADVVIPGWVPFVGGQKLTGLGFFFEHIFPHDGIDTSTTIAAWIDIDLFTQITVGFEVVIDANGNSSWNLIGGTQVTAFKQALTQTDQTYTFSTDLADAEGVTAGTTSIVAKIDWSKSAPGIGILGTSLRVQRTLNDKVEIFTEDQFEANGIKIITDARLSGNTSKVIQITNNNPSNPYVALEGDYAILLDVDAIGGNPFPNFGTSDASTDHLDVQVVAHSAKPIFGDIGSTTPYQPTLPTTSPAGTFPITVAGNVVDAYRDQTKVTLYRTSSADPFRRPVLIQTVNATASSTSPSAVTATFDVPIFGLDANAYTLIAVLNDGVNAPVSTNPSAEFTPQFAVRGTVKNQNGTPITGQTVFLDYDGNFVQGDNEPSSLTDAAGYAFTATFDPSTNWSAVPVNTPFRVVLPTLSNSVLDSGFAERDVTSESGAYLYNPTGTPWTFTGSSGLVANGSAFGNANAPEGNQAAFLQQKGSITQAVSLADGTYRLSFQAAQRPGNQQTFEVRVVDSGGALVEVSNFQPAGTSYQAYATDSFTVSAGTYSIEFVGTNTNADINGGDNTAFIDSVSCGLLGNFEPAATPKVTFDGTNSVVVPYDVKAKTAIRGVVFDDTDSNGDPAAGQPVSGATAYLDTNTNGVRDAGEPTAVTNAGGEYESSDLTGGHYSVRVDMSTVGRGTAGPAYVVPAVTPGSATAANVTYGMSFTTAKPVAITSLGVFDDKGNGLTTTLTAVFYDATTKVELARRSFTPDSPGTLVGGTRYLDLDKPIILPAGFQGMIVAYGFGATADQAGIANSAPSPWTTDAGGGRLTFGGGYQATTPNTFPTIANASGLPNPYAAGSFQYREVPWAASPTSATSHAVTLDNSTFDLVEGQNFGLLPPTIFFGKVTGEPVINGQYQPATPQAGVAVGLLSDRVVLSVDSGGRGGTGVTPDEYATGGQTLTTSAQVDTSRVPSAPAGQFYQTGRAGSVDSDGTAEGFSYILPGLSPGANYAVRLHFAEIEYPVAGERKFNVSIDGTQVLFDFDIAAAAGNANTAYAHDFQASADASGQIRIDFTAGSAAVPLVNIVQVLSAAEAAPDTPKLSVNSGGSAGDGFAADGDFDGGQTYYPGSIVVNTAGVLYAATAAIYLDQRQSNTSHPGDGFAYTLPGFEPGRSYTVRLHFTEAELWQGPNQRKFNVDINGQRVLTELDVWAAAGGGYTAYAPYFETVADANGNIVIRFINGSIGAASRACGS
jgi:hypothetical protein